MRRPTRAALRRRLLDPLVAPRITVVVRTRPGTPGPEGCVASVRASVGVRTTVRTVEEGKPLAPVVHAVRDPYVAVVDVDDRFEADGLAALVAALADAGPRVGVAAGRRVVRRGTRRMPVPPPGSPVDLDPSGKLFRPQAWPAAGGRVAVVDRVVLRTEESDLALPVTEQRRFRADLAAERLSALAAALAGVPEEARTAWCTAAVADLLPGLAADAVGGGPAYVEVIAPFARRVVESLPDGGRAPVEARIAAWAAAYLDLDGLARTVTHLLDHPHGLPVTDGRADLPAGVEVPEAWRSLGPGDRRLRARLLPAPPGTVRGNAFVTYAEPPGEIRVDGRAVRRRADPAADAWADRAFEEHEDSAFEAAVTSGPVRVAVDDLEVLLPVPSLDQGDGDVVVDTASLGEEGLRLGGTGAPTRLRLAGPLGTTPWADVRREGGHFDAVLPLVTTAFGEQVPPRGGRYRLDVQGEQGRALSPVWSAGLLADPPDLVDERLGLRPAAPGGLEVGAPLTRADASAVGQQRRVTAYAGVPRAERAGTVLLESFHGRAVSDNPAAIGRELLRRDTDLGLGLDLVWVVDDPGVVVPAGTRAAPRRTRAWYDALANAQAVVQNAAAPPWFAKKPGQVHLQTWHGTPLKRIGEDRGPGDAHTWRHRYHLAGQAAAWDAMVSPSPFCSEVFASAFRYAGPFLEVGYPRNDLLRSPQAPGVRAETRARLGLTDADHVVLYAPTWRDHVGIREAKPLFLDAEALVAARPDVVVLVRGHYNATRQPDAYAGRSRILDVTRYPDIADLYLAADVLVTDYSSVMFDFALTDKPMLFLVPDLVSYRDVERGFYLDFEADAPGPLLTDTREVQERLAEPDGYAAARARFRERFAPYDDGAAAARVCDWLLDALDLAT